MKRVFVCDDEPHIARLLEMGLRHAGCDVTLACDGREAIQALARAKFDLAVIDLVMPYFDGIEVLEYLRHELRSTIPVYLITQANTEGLAEQIEPFGPAQLLTNDGKIDWQSVLAA